MISPQPFSLPKEFEGFVSNSDSLLKQFERLDVEDAITITIYPDNTENRAGVLNLLDELTSALLELSQSYIWFKDIPTFALVVPDNKSEPPHIFSTVKFSDSIEDEWFITYIVLKLSVLFPLISISVTDTDGQFLLIEAADFIPDWIDPENCDNRLWIRKGKLHIVSLDEAGRNIHDCGIKISAALEAIKNRPQDTMASRQVQAAIAQRTTDVYPSKTAADSHISYCTVSRTIADLFQRSPELVSIAVNTFCLPAAAGSNKNYIAAMQKFGADLTDLESVPIRFTRLQYAKIMYQNFHIPKKFHTASVCVGNAENRELSKSFELGCRLSCGLESAYQRNKSEIGSNLQRYQSMAKLEKEQVMKRNTKAQIYYGSCHKEDLAVSTLIDSLLEGTNGECKDQKAIDKSCQEATYAKNLLKDYNMKTNILQEDSDSWMYLSPDELDKEMESRVKKFKENNSALNSQSVNKSVAAEGQSSSPTVKDDKTNIYKKKDSDVRQNEDAEQLQKMIEGMNLFLGSKSDISGVTTDIKRHDQKNIKMEKEKTEKNLADEVENCEKEIEIVKNNDSTKLASNSINDVHIFSSDWRSNLPSGIKNVDNMHQFDSNNDDDDDDDDDGEEEDQVREDIVIDFDKVLDILKNFNLTERKEEISKEDSPKPKENPLQDYFYDNDLTELSSDSGSDNDIDSGSDSDDEVENDATLKSANNEENFRVDSSLKVDMSSLTLNEEVEKFSEWGSGGKGVNHNIRTATVGVREIRFDNTIIKKKISRMGKHDTGKLIDSSSNDNTASIENKVTNKQCGDDDDAVRYDMHGISKVQDPKGSLSASSRDGSGSVQVMQRQIGSVQISNREEVCQGIINRDSDDSGDDDSFYDDSESETDSDDEVDFTAATQKGNGEKKKKSSSEYVGTGVQKDGSDGEDMERKNCYAEYEQTMDLELSSSTLVESFERYKDKPSVSTQATEGEIQVHFDSEGKKSEEKTPHAVDVDLNFLKYVLESHASQLGGAGPATQLFSQLGIQLPHLPPMNVKPDKDTA